MLKRHGGDQSSPLIVTSMAGWTSFRLFNNSSFSSLSATTPSGYIRYVVGLITICVVSSWPYSTLPSSLSSVVRIISQPDTVVYCWSLILASMPLFIERLSVLSMLQLSCFLPHFG
mmetsp:Transcript_17449/g.19706  ORF Transcript_17449/g.19706 Transcript_17449/m.19706 type:complete len:116 (+) Transcript_17449:1814-2161(+)